MSNPCKVILTRGKNKGKICGSVNSKCKHVTKPLICEKCGIKFDRTTSYYRHVNSCNIKSSKKSEDNDSSKSKIKLSINVKPSQPSMSNVFQRLVELEEQNTALREEVEVLKSQPVTNYNIAILGNDFYTELVDKIGKKDTIKFLAQSCHRPLDVFQKLYLDDCKPDNYPVACRDELHFRYLDNDKKMVDDRGGSSIGTVVSKQITNAMINAVNDCQNTVYSLDDIETIRNKLILNLEKDRDRMIKDLADITNNPNHPFFRDEV